MLILSYATSPHTTGHTLARSTDRTRSYDGTLCEMFLFRKYQSPCLQTFFVAPPASGKSGLSLIRQLVEPIHDKIR